MDAGEAKGGKTAVTDAYAIRTLTCPQVREVYVRRLTEDFPPDERKPLKVIESALRREEYACYGYFSGEELAAYAFFATRGKSVLLDYFSVDKSRRNQGLGSRFLQALIGGPLREQDCALLEVDDPDYAPDPCELEIRRGRLRFYLSNGLTDTGIRVTVHHVEYMILALPVGCAPVGQDALSEYLSIYRAMPPKGFAKKLQIEVSAVNVSPQTA